MPILLWDASALAKRYVQEVGSDIVEELFARVPFSQIAVTIWGYSETFSILLRRRNGGVISQSVFTEAVSALDEEFVVHQETVLLAIDNSAVFDGIDLMLKHNINSADASILAVFLRYVSKSVLPCIMIAADQRLLRAGEAEGLAVINPETASLADISSMLSL